MALSNLVNENEDYIKGAISEGIAPSAVNATLEDVVKKSDELGKTPEQVKAAVETIADMKLGNSYKNDQEYASQFVRENSGKIKSALNEGIKPEEVAHTLASSTNEATSKNSKRRLNFIVKLISKMKKKELNLKIGKEKGKGFQKLLRKTDKQ